MRRIVVGAIAVSLVLAYVAGFWPEQRRLVDAQSQVRALEARLASAEDRVRLGEILGQLLRLSDAVDARNYGEAATLSSAFFDEVRAEAFRNGQPEAKDVLNGILGTRDQVTTAIARTDPGLSDTLKDQQQRLRRALGYPVAGKAS